MAGFHTGAMPHPQSQARPAVPVVDVALVRPQQVTPERPAPIKVSPYGRRMTAEQKAHVRRRAAEGWPLAAIAAEVGFSESSVGRIAADIARVAEAAMIASRKAGREARQAEVWRLKSEGLTDDEVAARLGMTRPNVRKLKVSPEAYERYLAKAREKRAALNARRRKARGGLKSNFLNETARAIRIATGIGLAELKAPASEQPRPPGFVRARQILCWFAVKHRGIPLRRIGSELGIDHATVRNAVEVVQAAADVTPLPACWKPLHPVIAALIGTMQRADAERRQGQAARRPDIPAP